jgi:hypothetical protein
MKVLLDMPVSSSLPDVWHTHGHKGIQAHEIGLDRATDRQLLELARLRTGCHLTLGGAARQGLTRNDIDRVTASGAVCGGAKQSPTWTSLGTPATKVCFVACRGLPNGPL